MWHMVIINNGDTDMTNRDAAIEALNTIIETRGNIRASGVAIDSLPKSYNKVIEAAWAALREIEADTKKRPA